MYEDHKSGYPNCGDRIRTGKNPVFTLRQASRRSWRLGQKTDVKIYYPFYRGTMQERALQLLGSKMEASLAIEGKFSEKGLLAMTPEEDITTAMAKALIEGLEIEGAEQIWKKLNQGNIRTKPANDTLFPLKYLSQLWNRKRKTPTGLCTLISSPISTGRERLRR